VAYLRRATGVKKIGHAGTLDPFATGLLIIGVGRSATRQLDTFKGLEKTYVATIRLGYTSDTLDSDGVITPASPAGVQSITQEHIESVLQTLKGTQLQTPPMYSAKKIGGKKLYELARVGKVINRVPVPVSIYDIELLSWSEDTLKIRCIVSAGTYIRVLAADIGEALGTGAYCATLRRTAIGPYSTTDAISPKMIVRENWVANIKTLDDQGILF